MRKLNIVRWVSRSKREHGINCVSK